MKIKLTPKLFFFIMAGFVAVLIVGTAASLYFANGYLKKRSDDAVALKLQSHQLEEQLSVYRSADKDLDKYKDLQSLVERVVPTDKDQPRVVREVVKLANDNGIQISSISFPTSTLGQKTPAPAGGTSGTAAAAAALPPITQAKPVEGIKGVFGIQTTIQPLVDKNHIVTYSQLIDFLNKLELNRRTMQITNLQVTPQGVNAASGISFSLTVNLFVKP